MLKSYQMILYLNVLAYLKNKLNKYNRLRSFSGKNHPRITLISCQICNQIQNNDVSWGTSNFVCEGTQT